MDILIMLLAIIGFFLFVFSKRTAYKTTGRTTGVCVDIKTEDGPDGSNPHVNQMVGASEVMYRPYIRYVWQGSEYIAKSLSAYSVKNINIGDEVEILVNDVNRESVIIIKDSLSQKIKLKK